MPTFAPPPARALSAIDFERRLVEQNELIVRPSSLHELRQRVGAMQSNPSLRSGRTVGEGAGCPPHNDHNSQQPVDQISAHQQPTEKVSARPERSEGSDSNAILTFIPPPARALSVIDFERRVDEKNELIVRPNSLHELRQRVGAMQSNPSLRSGRTVGEGAGCPPHNDHGKQQTANSKQQTATGRSSIRSPVTGRSSIRSP